MSAWPAWRAVSSIDVQQHPAHRPGVDVVGNHGTPFGTGTAWPRSAMPAMAPRSPWPPRRTARARSASVSSARGGSSVVVVGSSARSRCRAAKILSIQPRSVSATCLMSPPTLSALADGVARACSSVRPWAAIRKPSRCWARKVSSPSRSSDHGSNVARHACGSPWVRGGRTGRERAARPALDGRHGSRVPTTICATNWPLVNTTMAA